MTVSLFVPQVEMSTSEAVSTPNSKITRSKVVSSPVTEISKNISVPAKRGVLTPRELESCADEELLKDISHDNGFHDPDDDSVEVSHAPLAGQNTLLRLGYTHPKMEPDNKTGVRVELIVEEKLKHIGFNELKSFLNEMGRNFFQPQFGQASPVLCREINGYPIPKTDKVCMFGKVLCKPDFLFLKKLFIKAAEHSKLVFCPETFASDDLSLQIAAPYFIRGVFGSFLPVCYVLYICLCI